MARPPKWNSPTDSVRLPAHLIPRLVELAKILDQPIPESRPEPAFQEYCDFVQNLNPLMVTTTASKGREERYLIDSTPITFEEFKLLQQIEADLYTKMDEQGLSKGDRLYVFSHLVEQWATPVKSNRGEING